MIKDKIIVITGASSGIGEETAKLLSVQGAIPILLARRMEKLKEVSLEIKGKHDLYQLDVTSTEQVFDVMTKIITKYGKIDILINNAGYGVFDYVVDASLNDYEEMIDTNYLGMVRCTKAVLPSMIEKKEGHIINIASLAGKIATAKAAGYSATKFAVIGFSDGLRHELKGKGVIVSTINPGPIDTPFFDRADPSGTYVKNVKWLMLSPKKLSHTILNVIKSRKKEKNVPYIANFGVKLFNLFPRVFDKLIGPVLNKK